MMRTSLPPPYDPPLCLRVTDTSSSCHSKNLFSVSVFIHLHYHDGGSGFRIVIHIQRICLVRWFPSLPPPTVYWVSCFPECRYFHVSQRLLENAPPMFSQQHTESGQHHLLYVSACSAHPTVLDSSLTSITIGTLPPQFPSCCLMSGRYHPRLSAPLSLPDGSPVVCISTTATPPLIASRITTVQRIQCSCRICFIDSAVGVG